MILFGFLILALSCLSSWLVILIARKAGVGQVRALMPQHHHTHTGIVPRVGGLGIVVGLAITYLFCFFYLDARDNRSLMHYAIFAGGVGAFLLGFIDDLKPLGAKVKLLAQVILGLLAHSAGLEITRVGIPFTEITLQLGYFSILVTVIWVVSIMNLINLIDGLDGLAGGVALMLMALLAYLAFAEGVNFSLILSLGMVGAIAGFLVHNYPPAKVYLGDSGAYMIGFVIAAISLLNSQKGTVLAAMIAPLVALALPICDVTFAIIRRGIKGLPLFRPDQGHIHHRLISYGYSRHKVTLVLYGFSLIALFCGFLAFVAQGRFLAVAIGVGFAVLLFLMRKHDFSPERVGNFFNESLETREDVRNALYLKDWFVSEAERADTGDHLWSDYRFVLRKMGFCRAELVIDGESRSFYVPNTMHDQPEYLLQISKEIAAGSFIKVYGEKEIYSMRQFEVVSDIAIECLSKATERWHVVNGEKFSFESEAIPATTYRTQKARNLYRPTY